MQPPPYIIIIYSGNICIHFNVRSNILLKYQFGHFDHVENYTEGVKVYYDVTVGIVGTMYVCIVRAPNIVRFIIDAMTYLMLRIQMTIEYGN